MDSHEARALLRDRPDDGLHSRAYLAQGLLLADIHEWMEEARTAWMEQIETMERMKMVRNEAGVYQEATTGA